MVQFEVRGSFNLYKTGPDNESPVDLFQSSFECCGTYSKQYWYDKDNKQLPLSCCRRAQFSTRESCGVLPRDSSSGIPFPRSCQKALNDFLKFYTGLLADILIFAAVLKIIAAHVARALSKVV